MADPESVRSNSARRSSLLIALAEVFGAALLLRALGDFFDQHHLFEQLVDYNGEGAMNALGGNEARFFLANIVAGLPAAALLADAAHRFLGGRTADLLNWSRTHARGLAVAFALFAAAMGWVFSRFILHGVELDR